MIEFESEEIEDAAMNGDIPIAAAFEVHLEAGKAPEILTYRCTEDIAREFEKRFSDDPLGNAASNFITARFMDFYKKSGMMFDRKSSRVICEYFICDAERIPEYDRTAAKICESGIEYPAADDLSDSSTDGGLCCAVVKDGKTVAIAGVNDFSDDSSTEVYVECAKAYRRRGYARCALSALCEFLIAEGKSASYKTYAENIPSCRLAESAGFSEIGRRMTAVGVRPDESE